MTETAAVRNLARSDGRYDFEAYLFVYESLQFTLDRVIGERRHMSGQELLDGMRILAIHMFGPLAKTVFEQWGVTSTEDFGEMVFALVDKGLLGKTDEDTKEDFICGFDFDEAFKFENMIKTLDLPKRKFDWKDGRFDVQAER